MGTPVNNSLIGERTVGVFAFADVAKFWRDFWFRLLAISAAVILPCLWHRHIEAGDLPSHVYNAWLAHLIDAGRAPGLWLARRWNNVLFDFALGGLGSVVGWGAAEKIATGASVLIFFWGAFALACAMTRRLCWFSLPCLAIIAYGWTFEMGFMNFYLSLGLAFLGLAMLLGARGRQKGFALVMVPLIWLAHPLGLAMFATIGAYAVLAEHLSPRRRLYLFFMSILLLVALHFFIQVRYGSSGVIWRYEPDHVHDGFDQLLLYGPQSLLPARLFRAFLCACLLVDVVRHRHRPRWWSRYQVPAEIYTLTILSVVLLPAGIDTGFFHRIGFLSIGFLVERVTTVAAVLACCLLGAMKPQKWHLVGFSVIALVFFSFLYQDTGRINRVEDELTRLVHSIPPAQRVVASIRAIPDSYVSTTHIIDRACIGHCFSYSNYEPAAGQFRVRANPGNPFVMSDWTLSTEVQLGGYVVQTHDLPLFEVYICGLRAAQLCLHQLVPGDRTISSVRKNSDTWVSRYNVAALCLDLLLASPAVAIACGWRWLTLRPK